MPDPVTLPKLQPVKVPDPPSKPVVKKLVRTSSKSIPEAILVSGMAFPREAGEKMRDVFSHYCDRMAVRLKDKYPGVKITVFNFYEGNQQLYEFSGTLLKKTVVQSWERFNLKNYRYVTHDDSAGGAGVTKIYKKRPSPDAEYLYMIGISETLGAPAEVDCEDYDKFLMSGKLKEKSLSMGHVYQYINDIGRAWHEGASDTRIVEMHIFSRGGARFGEPKLINSYYDLHSQGKKYDKDGDISDFGSNSTQYFSSAFAHPDGFIVNWGSCNDSDLLQSIRHVIRSKEYPAALKDREAEILQFEEGGSTFSLDWFYQLIRDDHLGYNYMKFFAERTFRKGYTAPPGVDVNLDDEKTQSKYLPLMHVFMGKEYGDPPQLNYQDVLKFYDEAMGNYFWDADGEYHKTYGRGYIRV